MNIIAELKRLVTEKRDELEKLEAALNALDGSSVATTPPHRRRKQTRHQYAGKRIVMPAGHYKAIIGAMLHANAGREVSVRDVVEWARQRGQHATKGAVCKVIVDMVDEGWLERSSMCGKSQLYRRAAMDPARWSTLYKEEGGS